MEKIGFEHGVKTERVINAASNDDKMEMACAEWIECEEA